MSDQPRWRNPTWHWVVIGFLVLFTSVAQGQGTHNLLVNSNFEAATLAPWNVNAWGGQMQAQIVSPGRVGGQSARLHVSANPEAVILRQSVDLRGGELYRATAWVKADRETSVVLRVRKNSPHWTVWGQQTAQIGTEWAFVSFDVAPSEDNAARFEIQLLEAGVHVQFDDIILEQLTGNRLLNPGFESASLAPWNINAWGGSMQAAMATPGRDGTGQSVRVRVVQDPTKVILRQSVELKGGETYQASVWLKASKATTVAIIVRKNSPHWTVWGQQTAKVGKTWKQYTFDVAPLEDNSARIEFGLTQLNIDVFIDDVSLIQTSGQGGADPFRVDTTRAIPSSLFGMHMNRGHVVDMWPTLTNVSPGMIRLWDTGTDWLGVEKEKGVYDWLRFDMYIQRIKQALPDSKIVYTFGRVPAWANGQQGISRPPLNMSDWRDFVTAVVDRHGQHIDYYEAWNEYNYHYFWSGTQQQMLEMAIILKEVVSAKDPNAVILTPNVTVTGLHRLEEYLAMGGGQYADAVSIHLYASSDQLENAFVFPTTVRSLMAKAGLAHMPIYNTEGAVTIPQGASLTPAQMRSYVARYYLLTWLAGLETSGWYFWENDPSMSRLPLVSDPGTFASLSAGGRAYQVVREWLAGSTVTSYNKDRQTNTFRLDLNLPDGQRGMIAWTTSTSPQTITTTQSVQEIRRLDGSVTAGSSGSLSVDQEPILAVYGMALPSPSTLEIVQ
ncbi:hypothetical protein CKO25_05175 [Thiocapsa imhoffii]|uniref:CBM-cenC domain-containing protein n=1 Tax=Thiocapsa imhoffii TaxID=382777 RepID=A0A9X0WGB6_9GAMM|nr:carbohydrate binding domain-containing protein [Thiocapsa imhoffii]MBK1644055.1 hypothetical protein [Thiocapsa imhoffii]